MPNRRALLVHSEPHYLDLQVCKAGSAINSAQTAQIARPEVQIGAALPVSSDPVLLSARTQPL